MIKGLPEVKVQRILYTTDLSENARPALAWAVDLANLHGAQLILLYVLDKAPDVVDGQVIGYIDNDTWENIKHQNELESEAQLKQNTRSKEFIHHILDQCRLNLRPDVICQHDFEDEVVVRRGNPVNRILETAKEKDVDLIVMGSHGHGNFLDAMLGVTVNRVMRRSDVPVLVVRRPGLHAD